MMLTDSRDGFQVRTNDLSLDPAQVVELFSSEWWSTGRSTVDVAEMLAASDVIASATDSIGQLSGFARALTDRRYYAVILDLIVVPAARKRGLGSRIVEALLTHPDLATVNSVELVCQPALVPFYERAGFSTHVGTSVLMRKTGDARLSG